MSKCSHPGFVECANCPMPEYTPPTPFDEVVAMGFKTGAMIKLPVYKPYRGMLKIGDMVHKPLKWNVVRPARSGDYTYYGIVYAVEGDEVIILRA